MSSEVCSEACNVFEKLNKYQSTVADCDSKILEKFVVALYDRSSTVTGVSAARCDMLLKNRSPTNMFTQSEQISFGVLRPQSNRQAASGTIRQ